MQEDNDNSTTDEPSVFLGPVPGLTAEMWSLVDEVPSELVLTVAINGLWAAWSRHKGGPLSKRDRNAATLAILACRRALIEGLPVQSGGIGGR